MKKKNLFGILLISIIALCFPACDKDDDRSGPIILSYENDAMFDNVSRCITVSPFIGATTPLYIKGGDGHYVINNSAEEVIDVEYNGETICFKPLAVGTAVVTIKDKSGNQYDLNVRVEYIKYVYIVDSRECIVEGDNMTVGSKKELENKILSSSAAQRYEFTFTDKEGTKGILHLYGQNTGGDTDYKEYDFENEQINTTITLNGRDVRAFARVVLKTANGNLPFYVTMDAGLSKSTGGDMIVSRYCFVRDLTEQFKTDYPALDNAYEVQTVRWQR